MIHVGEFSSMGEYHLFLFEYHGDIMSTVGV